MAVRAIRGATQLSSDDAQQMAAAVPELISEILRRNSLSEADLISVFFTSTPDLVCDFPARYAREAGLTDVPLMCAQEIPVPGALERVVRAMVHVETDRPRVAIEHVFLGGARALREDLSNET